MREMIGNKEKEDEREMNQKKVDRRKVEKWKGRRSNKERK